MLRALVYLSHSTKPLDVSTLRAMAEGADARNRADGVTGILSHRNGVFMQYIEGPAPAVDDLWVRLLHDDRHRIIRWVDVVVDDRRFGAWGMRLLDPLWLPTREPRIAAAPIPVANSTSPANLPLVLNGNGGSVPPTEFGGGLGYHNPTAIAEGRFETQIIPVDECTTTDDTSVRELLATAVGERDQIFGHLIFVNRFDNPPFEAKDINLLASVAAILGTHCGNYELYRQQSEFLADVVRALTSAIDAKDRYTCGHSDRVARIAVRLARELDCSAKDLHTIYMAGLLHDIGKIGISDAVLQKPGALTNEEYEHIKEHPQLGFNILEDIPQFKDVLPTVLHHHESWDGSGYPHGLTEDSIPLLARITAVADSFDAMSSSRCYRQGMPIDKVESILRDGAGKQWDQAVVNAYFRARRDILEIAECEREALSLNVNSWLQ